MLTSAFNIDVRSTNRVMKGLMTGIIQAVYFIKVTVPCKFLDVF